MKRNPEICPYCCHVILDDDQEYCDYCGMDIEEEVPGEKASGSCFGSIGTFILVILLFIYLVAKK
ncbi:hypothetical protein SAMN06297397_0941 [Aristaeella lactis]|uniref:Uncharacterized protein n=1 Tax=Aristaeella lactis TaxID=3046383 RepID=A0AC61PJN2_9FIRM|nr:hypothetical protein SAMN06297397_0941 [Aristaeella lactis]